MNKEIKNDTGTKVALKKQFLVIWEALLLLSTVILITAI